METLPESTNVVAVSKRFIWRLLNIFSNRAELLTVEIQEERERALVLIFFAATIAVLCLLAGFAITTIIVLAAKAHYFATIVALAVCYASGTVFFYFKVKQMRQKREALACTRDQLQKDSECFEKKLT